MILLVEAFLGGFIPMYLDNRDLEAQVQEAQNQAARIQEQLRVATLQNQLGMILIEVEQNNFGNAKERSTTFFDELRQTTTTMRDDRRRERLMTLLNRRDEITSDLTSLNPETAAKLRLLCLELHQISTSQ